MVCWPNGKASDYESGDCRFDPCVDQVSFCFLTFDTTMGENLASDMKHLDRASAL
jgi:hypothetical protein